MTTETVRLHISPLTPALLPTVLGPTLASVAQNIAFGEIQTFPERNYGFVDLPAADAERLKKKLSGAIFKGAKMKVDDARPKKRRRTEASPDVAEESQPAPAASGTTSKKKRKSAAENVVSGRELSPERKVKRAWTEPRKGKKSSKDKTTSEQQQQQPSKYTEKEELLFRTKVPASKTDLVTKKSKRPKKSKHGAEESLVHEFEKTITQPSFLKASRAEDRVNLSYVDGEGWVNDEGIVVEAEPASAIERRERGSRKSKQGSTKKHPKDDSKSLRKPELNGTIEPNIQVTEAEEKESDESKSDDEGKEHSPDDSPATAASASVESQVNENEQLHRSTQSPEVHPLESLFKKPRKPGSQDVAKPSLEISTAFSFFDHDTDNEDDGDGELKVPLTPFTSQDLRSRGLRSAAPTPDTAYPSRFNSHDSVHTSEDEEEQQEEGAKTNGKDDSLFEQSATSPSKADGITVSDFEKLFWEKRGDNNRAWKARRRAVLKENRHRDNRARRPKNW